MNQQDREHLRLLSWFHFVLAAIMVLQTIAIAWISNSAIGGEFPDHPVAENVRAMFTVARMSAFIIGSGLALLAITSGVLLAIRRWRMFCLVAAGIFCLDFPMGTILGVFTLIVLSRVSVKAAFAGREDLE